jgi:apolipoprotein N-acyltransferase
VQFITQLKAVPKDFILAFISAALLVLSFPKPSLYFLAWIGLVPLFIALEGKSLRRAFALSFSMGIGFLMGVYYWINVLEKFELTDFLLLGIYLGTYFGLFGLVLNFVSKRTRLPQFVSAPWIWVSAEYVRSLGGFWALPWPFLGYSQFLNLPLIQISSLTGVYGVSFLIVMVNAGLSEIIMRYGDTYLRASAQTKRGLFVPAFVSAGLVGLTLLYGFDTMAKIPQNGRVRVAVIQGNIPQEIRWNFQFRQRNFDKHVQLTRQAANDGHVSLIVWPETAVQGSLQQNKNELDNFAALSRDTTGYLLVGSAERPKFASTGRRESNTFNSAFLISPMGGIAGRYNKIRLLPFGEYLPYKKLPWPSRIASAWNAGEFEPGTEYTLFNLESVKFAVTICWENIFPDLFRQFVKKGANFTVNITNEAWFGETAAPYQFLAMSVFRAVENRISIVRAANTGVSAFIDPIGRILGTVKKADKDIFVEGYLVQDVPLSQARTFYTNYGDLFAFACITVLLAMFVLALVRTAA